MTITISSPASSASISGTAVLAGSKTFPSIAILNGSTTLSSVAVSSISFSVAIVCTTLSAGPATLTVTDGIDSASVPVFINNTVVQPTNEFTVNQPSAGASLSATFAVAGSAGTAWVNIAVWDNATNTKVGSDTTPSGGVYSVPVNMGSLSGSRTLVTRAFSVPAGHSGGSQTAITKVVIVTPNHGSVSTSTAPALLPYYGANLHYNQGGVYASAPFSTQAALMLAIGLKTARQDCYDEPGISVLATTVVPGFSAFGVTTLPCFIPSPSGSPANAYSAAYALGVYAAGKFMGVVPMIEFGNEWDLVCINGSDGVVVTDYNQTNTALYMAFMAGFTQGFRSVDTTKQCLIAMNGTYIHTGWLNMIVNNTLPNGAASGYTIALDTVTWHYYNTGGDMENVHGSTGTYNVFTLLAGVTSLPIYFSEVGAGNNSSSNSTIEAYINSQMPEFASQAQAKGWIWYELFDFTDGAYGLYSVSGSTYTAKGFVPTLTSFIAANPR